MGTIHPTHRPLCNQNNVCPIVPLLTNAGVEARCASFRPIPCTIQIRAGPTPPPHPSLALSRHPPPPFNHSRNPNLKTFHHNIASVPPNSKAPPTPPLLPSPRTHHTTGRVSADTTNGKQTETIQSQELQQLAVKLRCISSSRPLMSRHPQSMASDLESGDRLSSKRIPICKTRYDTLLHKRISVLPQKKPNPPPTKSHVQKKT